MSCRLIGHAIEYRVKFQKWIAGEIHLRNQTCRKCRPKQRKMNVLRTPRIRMIPPRVCARANGDKTIAAFSVGERLANSRKIWIQRSMVLIPLMQVPARCIGLPYLNQ